jgi:hypothetical protein
VLIENRALNEQAADQSLSGRQYFIAFVEFAANSAEFPNSSVMAS